MLHQYTCKGVTKISTRDTLGLSKIFQKRHVTQNLEQLKIIAETKKKIREKEIDAQHNYYLSNVDYQNKKFFSDPGCKVKLIYDPNIRQRKIVSTKFISSGESILPEPSIPFAYSIPFERIGTHCENCFKPIPFTDGNNSFYTDFTYFRDNSIKRMPNYEALSEKYEKMRRTIQKYQCDDCNQMFYCSKKCKDEYEQHHHSKLECHTFKKFDQLIRHKRFFHKRFLDLGLDKGYVKILARDNYSNARLLLKILCKRADEYYNAKKHKNQLVYEDVFRLISNRKLVTDKEHKISIMELEYLVSSSLDSKAKVNGLDSVEIIELIVKMGCNAFYSNRQGSGGFGLFPSASYFNHSCTPNCDYSEKNGTMQFYAIHDILPQTELNVSYIPLDTTCEKRKKRLKEIFLFECICHDQYYRDHDERYNRHHKVCNEQYLNLYLCKDCREGLVLKRNPQSEYRECFMCGKKHSSIC